MCDDCDCRSYPQIAALSIDHEVILDLLIHLRAAADDRDALTARVVLGELGERLAEHDHDELGVLLARCEGPGWRADVEQLSRRLADHIAREERDLFPAAHRLLRPDPLDAVDATVDATPGGPR